MVTSCCAYGCTYRHEKGSAIGLYRFPRDKFRLKAWVTAVKRENWKPTAASRICGKHFLTGAPKKDPNHPDYVPNVFSFNKVKSCTTYEESIRRICKNNRLLVPKKADNIVMDLKPPIEDENNCENQDASHSGDGNGNSGAPKVLKLDPIPSLNFPLCLPTSNSSVMTFIILRPSEELNKVADTSSTSECIEVTPDIPTVLKRNSTEPHSNKTKQNHSNSILRDAPSDFIEDTDSDISNDSADKAVNNSENESEFSEESSKCQTEKREARYKELQTLLKKYQKQCKLLTQDNDNLEKESASVRTENASLKKENASLKKENASHMKDNYSLMKENDSLKEVINSLREIISVSDEKNFEVIS